MLWRNLKLMKISFNSIQFLVDCSFSESIRCNRMHRFFVDVSSKNPHHTFSPIHYRPNLVDSYIILVQTMLMLLLLIWFTYLICDKWNNLLSNNLCVFFFAFCIIIYNCRNIDVKMALRGNYLSCFIITIHAS